MVLPMLASAAPSEKASPRGLQMGERPGFCGDMRPKCARPTAPFLLNPPENDPDIAFITKGNSLWSNGSAEKGAEDLRGAHIGSDRLDQAQLRV